MRHHQKILIEDRIIFLLCLRHWAKGTKEKAGKPIVVDHALVEHGIWTKVDSGGGREVVRRYILTVLIDGFMWEMRKIKDGPLVFWLEQLDEH